MNSGSVRSSNAPVGNVSKGMSQRVRILAVIESADPASSDLSERIVTRAAQLATQLDGDLHIASACPALSGDMDSLRVERYLPALRVKVRNRQRCAIRHLLRRLDIAVAAIHVEEGEPCRVIEALKSSLQASVVIDAATVSASGVMIGRTPASTGRLASASNSLHTQFAA